uniref:GAF domain-containing protein n=1 Tax=Hyaloperonospora arabidopsidis (strain Emoy2) TaxID=559515 RepID=M4B9H8_HYAAE
MPFLMSRSSPTPTTTSSSNTSTATSLSPQDPRRKVLISDEELLGRIHQSESTLALKTALSDPVSSWDSSRHLSCIGLSATARRETFELSSRMKQNGGKGATPFEVLTVGCIACSPQELVSVLYPHNENDYNVTMKAVYGRQFIYGSIVQKLNTKASKALIPASHHLSVKTGCFARSRMLGRNEQWCFLDYFQPTTLGTSPRSSPLSSPITESTPPGFSISRVSLSKHELAAGKAVEGRVDQLDHISTLLVVDTVPAVSKDVSDGNSTKLRVMFYAASNGRQHSSTSTASSASDKVTRARLVALAKGIPRLPAVVRRRRLGVQVFASQSVVDLQPATKRQNARCISCTKGIRLSAFMQNARRCQLCAYNVCKACWSRENIETTNGCLVALGVCNRCLEWVDRCDYSNVQDGSRGPLRIVDDPAPSRDSESRPSFGQGFRDDLAVESTKEAAVTVIKMLLDRSITTDEALERDRVKAHGGEENGYLSAVEEYFERRAREAPAAEDCILANSQQRAYALQPTDDFVSPPAPIPENEVARLECVNRLGLMDWKDPMPELDIICSFLSKELGFFCTMVAIVGETHQLVLSCTMRELVQTLLPREHTFCQHLVMGDAPFIVRHPEADIRFFNLNPVKFQGAKYYCGIPVVGPDGIMVGSICCVHSSAMDITRTQYDMLVRFGEIASRIIRIKVEATKCSSQRAHE